MYVYIYIYNKSIRCNLEGIETRCMLVLSVPCQRSTTLHEFVDVARPTELREQGSQMLHGAGIFAYI